ncbi:MAG: hypothetical protein HOF96_09985 [Candidatus Marinimicrobia bacterium]|nr:hypothetical protein [Candidatus Scalindua sp.]MBT3825295.1 hypothetical protein [Candidatus Neomarinimicrobiota bacterium]MBT4132704.1 hypothetical protein [Candidatus Neomarinimicrobiota bacterium]MBT4420715.1 hypothetical protein [Candidatus Neomarinimicrobiota bacterium]MBT6002451.1 hypothetical protein [Candidatus Neomarinimicrobiota bacterium]
MTKHKQVEIYSPAFERNIKVDAGIADLIELLHKLDIATYLSCQENRSGIMWIDFHSLDADVFLTICASNREEDIVDFDNSLYGRMMDPYVKHSWEYNTHPHDWAEKVNEEKNEVYYDGDSDIDSSISIRFPITDYPLIMERLHSHLVKILSSAPEVDEVEETQLDQ